MESSDQKEDGEISDDDLIVVSSSIVPSNDSVENMKSDNLLKQEKNTSSKPAIAALRKSRSTFTKSSKLATSAHTKTKLLDFKPNSRKRYRPKRKRKKIIELATTNKDNGNANTISITNPDSSKDNLSPEKSSPAVLPTENGLPIELLKRSRKLIKSKSIFFCNLNLMTVSVKTFRCR